ncbi:carbonic anhydrase [Variovorax sp. OV329]|uniref:carbonic anhydrase n=1 Tax=Variovorax sp. OV329 TaxID=1882825 RepID=UPI0008F1525A|nr:carbonic anhydrase [Variovorax sp. OV329]SFN51587.1 carbonic anhydrase [Variovorax sp. OV329]
MTKSQDALRRLREGNERFASGKGNADAFLRCVRRASTVSSQEPFAIVIGCSDSRVPVEIVFDQDLGDLFVIRVAGNIVSPSQLGSVEYAAAEFGSAVVMVLGHTGCGAVLGTLERLRRPAAARSPHMRFIAERIEPAVAPLLTAQREQDRGALIQAAVRANVCQSVEQLRHGSEILEGLIASGQLLVMGGVYDLGTGRIELLEEAEVELPGSIKGGLA